jgi:hypothetical protein
MSKLETNTIDNISGSSTLTIGDSNASTVSIPKNITLGASGTTITVPSGATITNNGTQSGFGGVNTPAFEAYLNSNQSIPQTTATKVLFDIERFDTNNAYDNTTNYRFQPTTAGKYFVYSNLNLQCTGYVLYVSSQQIRKNGSSIQSSAMVFNNNTQNSSPMYASSIIDLNGSTDYVEIFAYIEVWSGTSNRVGVENAGTYFGAYKIIE